MLRFDLSLSSTSINFGGGKMKSLLQAATYLNVGVCAGLEELDGDVLVSLLAGVREGRHSVGVDGVHVGALFEQHGHNINVIPPDRSPKVAFSSQSQKSRLFRGQNFRIFGPPLSTLL